MAAEKLREFSARIGLMSLRERVFIFVAAVIVLLALVQTLLIDPVQLRKKQASERVQHSDEMLATIGQQRQLIGNQAGRDPDQALRERIVAQEARLLELEAEFDKLERSLIPPERMNEVLKGVVRGRSGVRVVGFKTSSPQPVSLTGAADGAPPGFYRHGFEVTVNGRYADLVAYLEHLEALPWRLNWIEVTLDAAARPLLTLTLKVHTLSLEEAWLRV